jgi:hypothetical protein
MSDDSQGKIIHLDENAMHMKVEMQRKLIRSVDITRSGFVLEDVCDVVSWCVVAGGGGRSLASSSLVACFYVTI